MIQFTTIERSEEGDWRFVWPATSGPYRIVLFGNVLNVQDDTEYIYTQLGFTDYPPPLEVVSGLTTLADSEIDPPYLRVQWYRETGVNGYVVQLYNGTDWDDEFSISEVGAGVYSSDIPLIDGASYLARVVSFNSVEDQSPGQEYSISAIVHPIFADSLYTVDYNNSTHEIEIKLAP